MSDLEKRVDEVTEHLQAVSTIIEEYGNITDRSERVWDITRKGHMALTLTAQDDGSNFDLLFGVAVEPDEQIKCQMMYRKVDDDEGPRSMTSNVDHYLNDTGRTANNYFMLMYLRLESFVRIFKVKPH